MGGKEGEGKALKTASALILLEVAPATINYELRRQFGYSEGEATELMREALRALPRPKRTRKPRSRGR